MNFEFEDILDSCSQFPGIQNQLFKWWESQGNLYGIKALGFRSRCPNKEADSLGLHKDARSRRGVPPNLRTVDNSKKRGLKAMPKKRKRQSIKVMYI